MQDYEDAPSRNESAAGTIPGKAPVNSDADPKGRDQCSYNKGLEDGKGSSKPGSGFNGSTGIIPGKV